jgi:hypothetical protein
MTRPFASTLPEAPGCAAISVAWQIRPTTRPSTAAIDGHLATARGPWSDGPFVSAVLHLLVSARERAA